MVTVEIDGRKYFDRTLKILIQKLDHERLIYALRDVNFNDAVDSSNVTLLHLSIKYKNLFLTKFLIKHGCEIDPVDENRETPLTMALKNKCLQQVEILLAANADFHMTDADGKNALTMIFELGHRKKELEIIKLVLTKLTVMYPNEEELTKKIIDAHCSLDNVVYFNNPRLMARMLECGYKVNMNHRNNIDNTALHVAAKLNYLEIIKVLLKYGADPAITNKHGHIPLTYSIIRQPKQDARVIEALMPSSFDWIKSNFENDATGRLPLFPIFTKGTRETLEIFQTRYNIDLNAKDQYGETPLHYLMINKNEGILKPFRHAKFDVNTRCYLFKISALHLAASSGIPDSVEFLLSRGAEVDLKDLFGQTPLLLLFNYVTNHDITDNTSHKMNNLQKCVELLMLHAADPEVVSMCSVGTVLDRIIHPKMLTLAKPILAYLALLEISGKPIEKRSHDQIYSKDQLKTYYELCKQQLKNAKTQVLYGRVTVFKILSENEEKIALYTRQQDAADELVTKGFQLETYYSKLFKKRLSDAFKFNNLRKNVALLLSEIIGLFDPRHLVIDKIISLLNKRDLQKWIP